jgi:hypothetical protein
MLRRLLLLLVLGWAGAVGAGEARLRLCYNYGCQAEAAVSFETAELEVVRASLAAAANPAEERTALSAALGLLYAIAGARTPVGADRAGNFLDLGAEGRMDCIDHSTSTTRLLRLIEARGWLRFHRVAAPARRSRLIFQHFSAVIEETEGEGERERGGRYAIDSWFVNNGEAAIVLPLAEWLDGGGPNVH